VLLAMGALLFWLAVGFYSTQAAADVLHHSMPHLSLQHLISETLHNTGLMVITGLIVLVWLVLGIAWTRTGQAFTAEGAWADALTETKFGFDAFYNTAVRMLTDFCRALTRLQTGDVNYNAAAAAVGLIILLLLLVNN